MMNQSSSRELRTNNTIRRLYDKGLITTDQEPAARTLYRSCLQAYERTTDKNKPSYFGKVKFLFDSPLEMALRFITELPKEWIKWQDYQKVYDDRLDENDMNGRPSIDRIDSKGHYAIDNIQVDTIRGNYTDASNRRRKPVAVMLVKKGEMRYKIIESHTQAQEDLNVSNGILNKMKLEPYDVMDKNDDGELLETDQGIFIMPYIEATRKEFLKMEVERWKKFKLEVEGQNTEQIDAKVLDLMKQIGNPNPEQDIFNKQAYQDTLKRIELLESISSYTVNPDDISILYKQKDLYESFGWHIL